MGVRISLRLETFTMGISSNRLATRSDKAEVSVQIRDAQYGTIAHLDRATAF